MWAYSDLAFGDTIVCRQYAVLTAPVALAARPRVTFGSGWYDEERGEGLRWRWSSDRRATLAMHSEKAQTVDIAFGVQSAEPAREIRVTVGGTDVWRRTAHGVCAVSLDGVRLPSGDSILDLEMSGPPVAIGPRVVGVRLYDFGVAASSQRSSSEAVRPSGVTRDQSWSFSRPPLNRSSYA